MAAFKYLFTLASLVSSALAIVGVQWTLPNGQFTYVKTSLTVPENLVMGDNVYVWGFISTSIFGSGFYIGNANIVSTGNLEPGFEVHSALQKYSDEDYLWVGDKVTATYTRNMATGVWMLVASITRGPVGTAAGGLLFTRSETYSASQNAQGNTNASSIEMGSLVYSGALIPRKITWNNMTFKSTSSDTKWCKAYKVTPGTASEAAREFTFAGGPGTAITGGSQCILSSVSFLDPARQ